MVTLNASSLNVALSSNPQAEFHYAWLRDSCTCRECRHPDTRERLLVTSEIPDSIAIESADIVGDCLKIVWNDCQHKSHYPLKWLVEHDYSAGLFYTDPAQGQGPQLWANELEANIPEFQYGDIIDSEESLLAWCIALRDIGLTIIRKAPCIDGQIERFVEHIACVRETIYDRLHDVRATPGEYNAYNVASTTLELKPHTDMPNYNNPPGVQMFHFLVNDSVGGESTAVDGFMVAKQLKEKDPEAHELLSKTPITFRMFSSRGDVVSSNPLLTLDTSGELKVFRFSNQLAQPFNIVPEKMDRFYSAYCKLGRLVEDPKNRVQFRLETGDIMVTNNLRVMHGRNSYDPSTGARHLQLSYVDYDDILSRIRMLLKK